MINHTAVNLLAKKEQPLNQVTNLNENVTNINQTTSVHDSCSISHTAKSIIHVTYLK